VLGPARSSAADGEPQGRALAATLAAALALVVLSPALVGCAAAAPKTRVVAPLGAFVTPIVDPTPAGGAIEPVSEAPSALAVEAVEREPAPEPRALGPRVSASSARCPAEMALVDDRVCVDRWEASLVERVAGGERPWSPYLPVDGRESRVRAVSRPGVVPQGYISGYQAMLACNASGKRLCQPDEWERACRGPRDTQFPYGADRRAGACNDDIRPVHPVPEAAAAAGIAREKMWSEAMNLSLINQLPDSLLPTGSRAECTNDFGLYDMVGNLHEWVDDRDGTFRGGYYMDTTKNGDGCSYRTTAHSFDYHDYSTGFRCCMDPDHVE
jgi:hypothetical protein